MKRRKFLLGAAALAALPSFAAEQTKYPTVRPGTRLAFPRDHGAHPDFQTEWWYITAWLRAHSGEELGVQITFFRERPLVQEDNPSRFAPRQLLFAHAAVSDSRHGRLRYDQRAARAAFGMAGSRNDTTGVWIDDWRLSLSGKGYRATIRARDFSLGLAFVPSQPLLLQGRGGYSQKGPERTQASYYYSQPHLAASGAVTVAGRELRVTGSAWLDHEWASDILHDEAGGWDWLGVNFDDGGALMVFRVRSLEGTLYWAGGSYREPGGRTRMLEPREITFQPVRRWRSLRTGVSYPVAMKVQIGGLELAIEPVLDDQELDARATTGTIYWEGAVRVLRAGQQVGRGYLELTGYWQPLRL